MFQLWLFAEAIFQQRPFFASNLCEISTLCIFVDCDFGFFHSCVPAMVLRSWNLMLRFFKLFLRPRAQLPLSMSFCVPHLKGFRVALDVPPMVPVIVCDSGFIFVTGLLTLLPVRLVEHERARQAEIGIFELFKVSGFLSCLALITSSMLAFSFLDPNLQTHVEGAPFNLDSSGVSMVFSCSTVACCLAPLQEESSS